VAAIATRIDEAAAELARVAEALGAGVDVETRVLIGNPAEALAAFTKKERVDLASDATPR
jgi:nucleotide-binding universal stress UspA family protein